MDAAEQSEIEAVLDDLLDDLIPEALPLLFAKLVERGYGTDTGYKGVDEMRRVLAQYLSSNEDVCFRETPSIETMFDSASYGGVSKRITVVFEVFKRPRT